MEVRMTGVQTVATDPRTKPERLIQEVQAVPPAPKSDGTRTKEAGKEQEGKSSAKTLPMPEEIEGMVSDIRDYLSDLNFNLSYKVDDKTKDLVVQVLDANTGDVIRQLPPEDLRKLREKLLELRGVLFERKA